MSKIILAYSGGLDSAVILHWLAAQGHEVTAFTAQLGGHAPEFEYQAIENGATESVVEDLRDQWVNTVAAEARQMDAVYGKYLLHVALGKVIIAESMTRLAHQQGIFMLAHGAHSGENDYYRLHNSFAHMSRVLGVDFKSYVPWEDVRFKNQLANRDALLAYVNRHSMKFSGVDATTLTSEPTVLGINYENGFLVQSEDSALRIPNYEVPIGQTPLEITLHFKRGYLTGVASLDGRAEGLIDSVQKLDSLGRRMGIGIIDVMESNINDSKARCVYIQPASTLWHNAHMELGNLVLSNEEIKQRNHISQRSGELIYYGQWFSEEMIKLRQGAARINQSYNGWVRMTLYPGFERITGRGVSSI